MQALKDFFAGIPAPLKKLLEWAFVVLVVAIIAKVTGVQLTTPPPPVINVTTPAPVVTVVSLDDVLPSVTVQGTDPATADAARARDPHGNRKLLIAIARMKAGKQYAKENPPLTESEGMHLARSVPQDKIEASIAAANIDWKTVDAAPVGGPFLDWLKAHPEIVQQIIQIILTLITLFAKAILSPFCPWIVLFPV